MSMTSEFVNCVDDLSPDMRLAVLKVIDLAKLEKRRCSVIVDGGGYEVYAYPFGRQTAWGINCQPHWECIARGVV